MPVTAFEADVLSLRTGPQTGVAISQYFCEFRWYRGSYFALRVFLRAFIFLFHTKGVFFYGKRTAEDL